MTRPTTITKRFRIFLEYIPLIIILVYTFFLFKATADDGILLVWKNYIGFIFLAATITLFFVRHLFGVLALGLTLVLGFLGILSYSPGIWTMSIRLGDGAIEINSLPFQPIFLLWIAIYFIVSWPHVVGIGTKKYWDEVKSKKR